MILNSPINQMTSLQFRQNLDVMIELTDNDLLDKPFILYRSNATKDYNLFTMGLWRYNLPEIIFPTDTLQEGEALYRIVESVRFILNGYKDSDAEDINITELENLMTLAQGIKINIRIKDTEEFFWGHGMPHRYYLGDEYVNVLVLEITYGDELDELISIQR